ncbi:family 10 glycosylhydrolase [Candidatus Sumerlaeota bacterium]|nr:family 10 glycosylhydrolase [Candidatus Sumerlaeota bacterium]
MSSDERSTGVEPAEPLEEPEAVGNPAKAPAPEYPIRGIWVESQSAEMRTQAGCATLVGHLRKINVDDVFIEMRSFGDAYYYSELAVTPSGLSEDFLNPLGTILSLAHRPQPRALRVHAVINPFRLYNDKFPFPPPADHLINLHPEWVSSDYMGNTRDQAQYSYLDPGVPEVQEYLELVVRELVSNYPVDGIDFVDFRYPGLERQWGYNPAALERFRVETGRIDPEPPKVDDPAWLHWRSEQLTQLLKRLSDAAHKVNPDIIVSTLALSTGDLGEEPGKDKPDFKGALQDWPHWCQLGLVDWLVLANAHTHPTEQDGFVRWIDFANAVKGPAKLVVMVDGPRNFDADVVMQMRVALGRSTDGVMLYSYQKPAVNNAPNADLLDYIAQTVFAKHYPMPAYVERVVREAAPTPIDFTTDTLIASNLAPPVPLPTAASRESPDEPTPVPDQTDMTAALLQRPLPAEPTPSALEPDLPPVGSSKEIEQRLAQSPRAPDPFAGEWATVRLRSRGTFIGRTVGSDEELTVFQMRRGGVMLTLHNSDIVRIEPIQAE